MKKSWIGYATLLFCFVLLLCIGACDAKRANSKATDEYFVILGSGPNLVHEPESVPHFEPGGNGEEIVLDLNGHPLLCVWERGYLIGVNQYLRRGDNVLTVSGDFSKTGYLRVAHFRDGILVKDLATKEIPAGKRDATVDVLNFVSDVDYDFENETIDGSKTVEGQAQIRGELKQRIDQFFRLIDSGSMEGAKKDYYEGYTIYAEKAFGQPQKEVQAYVDQFTQDKFWLSSEFKVLPPNWADVRFLYGDQSVLVFSGWSDAVQRGTLLRLEDQAEKTKGRILNFHALRFVRREGRWVMW